MKYLVASFFLITAWSLLALFLPLNGASADTVEPVTEPEFTVPPLTEVSRTEPPREPGGEYIPVHITVYNHRTGEISQYDLEDYLVGVLFAEISASFEPEAVKAQAVAARSYCSALLIHGSDETRSRHSGADICTDYAHCTGHTAYADALALYGAANLDPMWEKLADSVAQTRGEIITYEMQPANAVFHAFSPGITESAKNVWGGDVPYLVAVETPENGDSGIRDYDTEMTVSYADFRAALTSHGFRGSFSGSPESWIGEISVNSSGRVDTLAVCGINISGIRMREIFSLRSTMFTVTSDSAGVTFRVTGYGHGVGMSQHGANIAASEGMNYVEILKMYYTGVSLNQASVVFCTAK